LWENEIEKQGGFKVGTIATLAAAFKAGGIWMWPILAAGAIGMAIVAEKWLVLRNAASIQKDELIRHLNGLILQGQLDRAISMTAQSDTPITNIVRAGLMAVANNGDAEEVQTAMDAVALREVPRVEKRIGLLATVANVATLLGLLGTVSGMIGAFGGVANAAPSEKASILSHSISEAMNATCFGLFVAIPMLVCFGYFSSTAQGIIDDIHEISVTTLNFVMVNKEKLKKHG